jgi:NADPH:quinone reductase-like Zn-dependent oxidoreductase
VNHDAEVRDVQTDTGVPTLMRAVVLTGHGGIDKLVTRDDVPTPQPGVGEVLVRVGACGLNNTDINTRSGWYDRKVASGVTEELGLRGGGADAASSWNKTRVSFPRIQGAAVAGRIVGVGEGIDPLRIGQRVLVDPSVRDPRLPHRAQLVEYLGSERDGGFAEFVVVPSLNARVVDTPLSDAELATFPCSYDTAEEMLVRADLSKGETILITGASGGVGTALIQLARARGARVVAVSSASKKERLESLGVRHFVARDPETLQEEVELQIGESGVDVVADVVGGPLFGPTLKVLRRGGRYTTSGAIGGPLTEFDLRDLIYKDLEMYGITNPTAETFARLVSLIEAGRLAPILEAAYPLEELRTAQEQMVKRTHVGKFVVVP